MDIAFLNLETHTVTSIGTQQDITPESYYVRIHPKQNVQVGDVYNPTDGTFTSPNPSRDTRPLHIRFKELYDGYSETLQAALAVEYITSLELFKYRKFEVAALLFDQVSGNKATTDAADAMAAKIRK